MKEVSASCSFKSRGGSFEDYMADPSTPKILIGGTFIASSVLTAREASSAGGRLLVFVHTTIKQRALQSLLREALPSLDVTTVGRVADFERALKSGQDAVLTLPIVMKSHGMSPSVRGVRHGSSDESYSLVSVGKTPDVSRLKSVGALDLLDRRGTTGFVRDLLDKDVKVQRVTKVEDLLPLLQLDRAEAVLLPTRMISDVRSQSSLNLAAKVLPRKLGLPALASVSPQGAKVVADSRRISGRVAELLGVDGWK